MKKLSYILIVLWSSGLVAQDNSMPHLDFENFADLEVEQIAPNSELNPYLLMTVRDLRGFGNGTPIYSTGMMVIDIHHPRYPLLYLHMKNIEGCGSTCAQVNDARVYETEDGPLFMVYKETGHLEDSNPVLDFNGFILYDENLEPLDSISTPLLDFHDLAIHPVSGNKVYAEFHLDSLVFPAELTGFPNDSMLLVNASKVIEIDPDGNEVFTWISPQHLVADDTYWDMQTSTNGIIDWDHWNSVTYDYDGNLLLSFRHIGLVKVFKPDSEYPEGRTMVFSGKNSPFNLPPEHTSILQHNFYYNPNDGYYYCYSNGNPQFPDAELQSTAYGFIYDINWQDTTYTLIEKFTPYNDPWVSLGAGNWHKNEDGSHIFNLGGFLNFLPGSPLVSQPSAFYMAADNEVHYEFIFEETGLFSYQFHSFDTSLIQIQRPEILCEIIDGDLVLSTSEPYDRYLWSTGETTSSITLQEADSVFVAVAINDHFASSSLPQYFDPNTAPCNIVGLETIGSASSSIRIQPNPSKGDFLLSSLKEQRSQVTVFNSQGVRVFQMDNLLLNTLGYSISLEGLGRGTYFILVRDLDTGWSRSGKILLIP